MEILNNEILQYYLMMAAIFLMISSGIAGYHLKDYNLKIVIDAIFWPISLINLLGAAVRGVVNPSEEH